MYLLYLAEGTTLRVFVIKPENFPKKPLLELLLRSASSEIRIPFKTRGLLRSDTSTLSRFPYSSCTRQHERMLGKATKGQRIKMTFHYLEAWCRTRRLEWSRFLKWSTSRSRWWRRLAQSLDWHRCGLREAQTSKLDHFIRNARCNYQKLNT